MIYAGEHHNWDDSYLVLLDPAIGKVRALLAQEPSMSSTGIGQLQYLDATMKTIKTEELTWKETQE